MARGCIQRQERAGLEDETFTRPNTKYTFDSYTSVDINMWGKRVCQNGCGPRRICMRWILSTTISVFRCLEVHRGAHKKNDLRITRRMAQDVFAVNEFQMQRWAFAAYPVNCKVFQPRDHCLRGDRWERLCVVWTVNSRGGRGRRRRRKNIFQWPSVFTKSTLLLLQTSKGS